MHGLSLLVLNDPDFTKPSSTDDVYQLKISDGNGFNQAKGILEVSSVSVFLRLQFPISFGQYNKFYILTTLAFELNFTH